MKLKKLSKFLPGFLRKPGAPKPKPVLTVTIPEPQPAPIPEPGPVTPTKAQKILDDVCAFLARYLHCSQDQRTVLALWLLHTWCFSAARSSPYLAIQSSRKLSGKTLCLRLLSLLCSNPALTSGYTASALVKRIHSNPKELPTFLLDESPATLGSRGRSKNPKLRAILVSGFQPGIGYSDRSVECTIYSPKAFASTGPLPEALADCSIPIVLQPWNARVAQQSGSPARAGVARDGVEVPSAVSSVSSAASDEIERLDLITAQQQARPLIAALQKWSEKNLAALKSLPAYKRQDFPDRLTSRGQDIVEPLLQLADAVGGDYPARARQALVAMFDDENDADRSVRIQLLRDIRQCFEHHAWPDKLHTSVILAWLLALPPRPWDVDGPITDRTLARLLRPHGIRSRLVRVGSVARGYRKDDFATPWNFLLDNAGKTSEQHTDGINKPNATPTQKQEIPGNHTGCNIVTDAQIDPRIKGILDDPRNYYRQYPDEFRNWIAGKVDEYEWPNPADNQNRCPHGMGMHGGYSIPLSCINTPPWNTDTPPPRAVTARSPRFPVTLNRQERIQVALARLYEIRANQENRVAQQPRAVSAMNNPQGAQAPVNVSTANAAIVKPSAVISDNTKNATATPAAQSKIFSNDGPCNTVTDVKIDPRIKGILDDPRNFYRQYPEQNKKNALGIITRFQQWPQPADDKGRPNVIFPLEDGINIPYTLVNRDPFDPDNSRGYHYPDERWPVLLTDQEKAQLAVARFYEIYLVARAQREKNRTA